MFFFVVPLEPSARRLGVSKIFRTSSSKHCCTLMRVLALHSIRRHPYSLAKFMPSLFVTTLSLS
uniref:Uncharacterized protein MANES_12G156300 n=1 Tax=Rhizophora mucronata TaxID=61149 RepID=A0A2P2K659_RHIMU